jgi:flagellar biogenesis protein FliO
METTEPAGSEGKATVLSGCSVRSVSSVVRRALRDTSGRPQAVAIAVAVSLLFLISGLPQRAFPAGNSSTTQEARSSSDSANSGQSTSTSSNSAVTDPESRPLEEYQPPGATTSRSDTGGLVVDVFGKLAVVVVLILACAAGWRKLQAAAGQRVSESAQAVQLTSTVALAPQRFLHLVTVGQQRLLLASSPQQVCLIAHLDSGAAAEPLPEESAGEDLAPAPDRFEYLLQRLQEVDADSTTGAADRDVIAASSRPTPVNSRSGGHPRSEERPRDGGSEPAPPHEAGPWSGSLTPGALFRTSSETGAESSR